MTTTIVVERFAKAKSAAVYKHLIESDRWVVWQGVSAILEPQPGGLFQMNTLDGRTARGSICRGRVRSKGGLLVGVDGCAWPAAWVLHGGNRSHRAGQRHAYQASS